MPDIPVRLSGDKAPRRVSAGTKSRPSDKAAFPRLGRLVKDATPKVVSRGSVSRPRG